ncbi:kinase-like domain-containing protein [Suillus paluster]|uniref:kinase-like domain-containing protein n=1 Tax=Suillus paluster TaxID=48578 RepID=UPI001B8727C2|nr:kinase-like domain-containing protein [Suillus paluster]KAG1723357.1 kinase-like domain-containing protein [Suillus paluster]
MYAQPGPSQAMRLAAVYSSSTTNFAVRHRHRQHPYVIPGREPSAQRLPILPRLIQRREHVRLVIQNIEKDIQTILAQTGGCPDEAWTAKLERMHVNLHKNKTLLVRGDQAIQQTSNPNNILGANLAHLNTMASAAGPVGIMQGGGMSQQPWLQSVSPTPGFGLNPGIGAPTTDQRSANGIPPPHMAGTNPTIQSGPILPPTQEQLAHAMDVIQNLKRVFSAKPPTMQLHALPDDQRMEYNQLLERLHKMTRDLDAKLPMYCIVLGSDDMIRNLVAIVSLVAHQRTLHLTRSNLVIIDPSALKSMYTLLRNAIERFEHHMMEFAIAPQQTGGELADLLINRPFHPPTIPNDIPSTQSILQISIPDLTGLITRCSQDPVSGGTYGNIYKCIYHGPEGDVMVAVKAMRPQFFNTKIMFVFRRELGIWKRLQHHNILKFMGTTEDFGSSVALVAPWIVNDTLTSFLNNNSKTLTLRDRLLLLRDVAAGLHYLHTFSFTVDGHTYSNPVVHGDLTGNNVLIGSDRTAYLADFGLSGTLTKLPGMTYLAKMSLHPGALRWAAPELLSVEQSASAVTTQSDIYSLGSIMLQVLTGNVPWHQLTNDFAIWLKVIGGERNPRPDPCYVTDQQWCFITRCCSETPMGRPSAGEALEFLESELA